MFTKKRIASIFLSVLIFLLNVTSTIAVDEKNEIETNEITKIETTEEKTVNVDNLNNVVDIRNRINELETSEPLKSIYEMNDYYESNEALIKTKEYKELKSLYEKLLVLDPDPNIINKKNSKAVLYLPLDNSTRYRFAHGIGGTRSDYIYQFKMNDGRIAFCIEFGKRANNGENYTESNFDIMGGWSEDAKKLAKMVIHFGWNTSAKTSDDYILTQLAIWDIAHGKLTDHIMWNQSYYMPYNELAYPSSYVNFKDNLTQKIRSFIAKPNFVIEDAHKDSAYYQYTGRKLSDIGNEIVLKKGHWLKLKDTNKAVYDYTHKGAVGGDRSLYDIKLEGTDNNILYISPLTSTPEKISHKITYTKYGAGSSGNAVLFSNTIPTHQKMISVDGFEAPVLNLQLKTLSEDPNFGIIKVIKKDKNTGELLAGAKFEVTNNKDSSVETLITNSEGWAKSKEYEDGTEVTVKEIEAPSGYQIDDTSPKKVTISKNTPTIEMTFTDTEIPGVEYGKIKVIKKDSKTGQKLGGAKFKVNTSYNGTSGSFTLTTNSLGEATSSNIPVGTDFTIEETTPPPGYNPKPSGFKENGTITTKDQIFEVIFENDPEIKEGSFRIVKVDKDTAKPIGNTEFAITINGTTVNKTTDSNGVINWSTTLPEGTVVKIKEVKPAPGYKADGKEQTLTIKANSTVEITIQNEAEKGNIELNKTYLGNWKTGIETETGDLKGAEFGLYDSGGNLVGTETTDSSGKLTFKNQLLGTYILRELKAPEGYDKVADITVTLGQNGQTIVVDGKYTEDKVIKRPVKIVKIDSESKRSVKVAGAEFKILHKASNRYIKNTSDNSEIFKTNSNGEIEIKDVMYGEYELKEVKAPENYTLNNLPVTFKVDDSSNLIEVEFENERVKGEIEISKLGQKFFDTSIVEVLGYNTSVISITEDKLMENVKFELYSNEDITGKDGTVYHNKDKLIDTKITDSTGITKFENLEIGKYYLVEKEVETGYVLSDKKIEVEVKYKDDVTNIVKENVSILNKLQEIEVNGTKISDDNKKLENVILGLFSEEDITIANKTIAKDTLLGVAKTDVDGNFKFKDIKVPEGKYYIKELKTVGNYTLDDRKFPFEYSSDNNPVKTITIGDPVVNEAQKHKITINKLGQIPIDVETEKSDYGEIFKFKFGYTDLEGAEFDIYSKDENFTLDGTKQYSKDEKLDHIIIGKNGVGETSKPLHIGNYYLKETKAPQGYKLLNKEIAFEVKYLGQDIKIGETKLVVENDWQDIKINVHKEEEKLVKWENGVPVYENIKSNDKVFGVYIENAWEITINGETKTIPKDSLLGVSTTKEGIAEFKLKIPKMKVYVKEIDEGILHVKNDKKYNIDYLADNNEDVVEIDIRNNGQDGTNETQENILNKLYKKSLILLKLSEVPIKIGEEYESDYTEKTKDVVFGLYDEETKLLGEFTTNADGIVELKDLPIGKYYIKELRLPEGSKHKLNEEVFEINITKEDEPSESSEEESEEEIEKTKEENTSSEKIKYDILVKNDLKKGKGEIEKVDKNTKAPIEGAKMKIEGENTEIAFVSKKEATSMTLPEGKYKLSEVEAPSGYSKSDETKEIEIKDGETVKLEYENEKVNPIPQSGGKDLLLYIGIGVFTVLILIGFKKIKNKNK